MKDDEKGDEDESAPFDDLLRVIRSDAVERSGRAAIMDGVDSTEFRSDEAPMDWTMPETREAIRDCFVTGKWGRDEDAEKLLSLDDDDEEVFGDFEDLETGEVHKGEDAQGEKEAPPRVVEDEKEARKKRLEEKKRLKAKFDLDYDEGGKSHYDELKREVDQQTSVRQ